MKSGFIFGVGLAATGLLWIDIKAGIVFNMNNFKKLN